MTLGAKNSVELFAQRMERRAKVMPLKVAALMRERFDSMANKIFLYNPVWSSQSVVNWTASIGHRPLRRLVNVDRSNASIRGGKFRGNTEGERSNITPHNTGEDSIAATAASSAWAAAQGVSSKYRLPKNPKHKSKSIWLTNNISYTGKLWRRWPTNKWVGGLPAVVKATSEEGTSIKVWRF